MSLLPSIRTRLQQAQERHEEIAMLLATQEVMADQNRFRELSVEYSQLEPVVNAWSRWQKAGLSIKEAQALLGSPDADMKELAEEEVASAKELQQELERELNILLLPRDPDDDNNIFLEIRAGTGGDEAALFAGDLFRMYQRYVESKRWQIEVIKTATASTAVSRKSWRVSSGTAHTPGSSSNPAPTACSVSLKPNPRDASTPPPARSPSSRKGMRSKASISRCPT